jgi:hypothetical protein
MCAAITRREFLETSIGTTTVLFDIAGAQVRRDDSEPVVAEYGPRESPVWFHWDGGLIRIIGGTSFPKNLKRQPVCAIGIVDWDVATGLNQHVGLRGRAEVVPFDAAKAKTIFRRYFGPDEQEWDGRFADVFTGELGLELIRFVPETVIMRDQSYTPTQWARQRRRSQPAASGRP